MADRLLTVPTDKGANAGWEGDHVGRRDGRRRGLASTIWRCCGTGRWAACSTGRMRPSTLGSFLRAFTVRSRPPARRGRRPAADRAGRAHAAAGRHRRPLVCVDIDDTVIEVHGYAKQGAGFGYTGVRGLNALHGHGQHRAGRAGDRRATAAEGVVRTRPAARAAGPRRAGHVAGAARGSDGGPVLLRADSAFYGHATVGAAVRAGGAGVDHGADGPEGQGGDRRASPTTPGRPSNTPRPSTTRPPAGGSPAPRSPRSRSPHSAPASRPSRSPAGWSCAASPTCNPPAHPGQAALFDLWRFHAFFTTSDLDTVTADKTHRGHAIIEQVNADLKNSALAHLPSGRSPPTPPGWSWP